MTVLTGRTRARDGSDERVVLRVGRRFVILPQQDIGWIEADGNYVIVHADGRSVRTRAPISTVIGMLGPSFVQIHRSAVVNLDHLVELHSEEHGDMLLVLRDGSRVRGSRQYRGQVQGFMTRGGPGLVPLGRSA
jgi:two-component system LytT family response regulator